MDPITYLAAKSKGAAAIKAMDKTTVLITLPGGFDQRTGEPLPPVDKGYQRADFTAMREGAQKSLDAATQAVIDAQAALDAFDTFLAEVAALPVPDAAAIAPA